MSFLWSRFLAAPKNPDGFMSPPAFFYRLPELETEDLILRKPRMRDAKDIFRYASDPEVARYVLWESHRSVSETASFVRDLRVRIRAGYPSSWVVSLRETGLVIGTIGFVWYSTDNNAAELGYSFSREYWNQGYATEALKKMIAFVFETGVHKIIVSHIVGNDASKRVVEKCGLIPEGRRKEELYYHEQYHDVDYYYLLNLDK